MTNDQVFQAIAPYKLFWVGQLLALENTQFLINLRTLTAHTNLRGLHFPPPSALQAITVPVDQSS